MRTFFVGLATMVMLTASGCGDECSPECDRACKDSGGYCVDEEDDTCHCRRPSSGSPLTRTEESLEVPIERAP